jgi:hypothetical protein
LIAVWLWSRVVAGYGVLTCVLTWPLPRHLQTHLLGDPTGDLGTYVWNVWIFRHELLRHAHLPVSTDHVFAYSGGADFTLHNYAPLAGLLGSPLVGPLGVVGAFNALMLVFMGLSGLGTFILARRLGLGTAAAWLAGALFMASPALVARETAHFSLVIAGALPLFLWALVRTLDTGRVRDAVLVGIFVAAAYYSDAYYGIYCALMGAFVVIWPLSRMEWPVRVPPSRRIKWGLHLVISVFGALIVWRVSSGTRGFTLGPIHVGLETLYTPQLVLVVAIALRVWLAWRPVLRLDVPPARVKALLWLGLVSVGTCLLLLLPELVGMAIRVAEQRMPETGIYWRSSPRGIDVLAYFVPNPNHAWFGDVTRPWFMPDKPDAFPEFVGSFSLVAFAIIAVGAMLRLLPRVWLAFAAFFFSLSLGPFVHVAGINTYMVGPWAFLRYVPVIGMARSPSRFAIVAILGMSLLVAFTIDQLFRRYHLPRPLRALAIVALAMELVPAPRPLFSADVPEVYQHVAVNSDEEGRLLELPTGIRDGTSSVGNFNASSEYFQTQHRRPLVGGYLSRISPWRKRQNDRAPMLRALFALSEGRQPPPEWIDAARESRDAFLRRSCVKFVVVNKNRVTSDLQAVAVDLLRLTAVYADAGYALFTPADPPACDPPAFHSLLARTRWPEPIK